MWVGKDRVPNPSPLPVVVDFSLRGCVGGTVVGLVALVSGLLTLLVRFGGVELGRGLRVRRFAVGGSCADAPRIFDVAVMRVRLGLKRVRGIPDHSSSEC